MDGHKILTLSDCKCTLSEDGQQVKSVQIRDHIVSAGDLFGTSLSIEDNCSDLCYDRMLRALENGSVVKMGLFHAILWFESYHRNDSEWIMDDGPEEWDAAIDELLNRLFVD
jgi:hypothetical protein